LTSVQNQAEIKPIILDVASGVGRYLFELHKHVDYAIELQLNDIDENSIKQSKILAKEFGINHITHTSNDIFSISENIESNNDSNQGVNEKPNIVIISGLFELYENNALVHRVISHLFSIMQDGGYIVYTGQPWHPQLEMIGRLLNNRQGERWIMRRRVQAEIDQLISSVGFEKMDTVSDEMGIFTVSCSRKP